jgi:hypothetical protein
MEKIFHNLSGLSISLALRNRDLSRELFRELVELIEKHNEA